MRTNILNTVRKLTVFGPRVCNGEDKIPYKGEQPEFPTTVTIRRKDREALILGALSAQKILL